MRQLFEGTTPSERRGDARKKLRLVTEVVGGRASDLPAPSKSGKSASKEADEKVEHASLYEREWYVWTPEIRSSVNI